MICNAHNIHIHTTLKVLVATKHNVTLAKEKSINHNEMQHSYTAKNDCLRTLAIMRNA